MMQNMINPKQSFNAVVADSSGARRASEESAEIPTIPDPEVSEKRQRRRFTAQYKRSIVEQAEACQNTGDVGALLRREGLYSSSLSSWRRQYRQGALDSLNAQARGPKPRPDATRRREVSRLEKRVAKLEHELVKAHAIIDVQKKLSVLLANLSDQEES
jgi:transposase-like protein